MTIERVNEQAFETVRRLVLTLLFASLFLGVTHAQRVGDAASDFSLVDAAGERIEFSSFAGTPVVLNFWASWCPPCVEELPLFERLEGEVNSGINGAEGAPNVNVLLVNNNEDPEAAASFLDTLGVSLPSGFDATREAREAFRAQGEPLDTTPEVVKRYRVRGMPTTFFIDADGVIRAVKVGGLTPAEAAESLATIGVTWQP